MALKGGSGGCGTGSWAANECPCWVWMGTPVLGLLGGSGVALLPAATRVGESGDRQFTAPEGKPSLALRSRAEEMTVGGFFRHAE